MSDGSYVTRIDSDTLLPLEETFYGGDQHSLEHVVWTYALVESIPTESVESGLFDFAPASELTVESRAYLGLADAKAFETFPVYFLGSSYNDMRMEVIMRIRGTGPGYAKSSATGEIERVEVVYQAKGQTLHVLSQPLASYHPREAAPGEVDSGTPVRLSSGEGLKYGDGAETTVVTMTNGSIVTVIGIQAMEAANHLARMN